MAGIDAHLSMNIYVSAQEKSKNGISQIHPFTSLSGHEGMGMHGKIINNYSEIS